MKRNKIYKLILTSFLFLVILACNAIIPVPKITPSPVPPTVISTSESENFVISTRNFSETGQDPEYRINAQYPAVLNNNAPGALAFSDQMYSLVQNEIEAFKNSVAQVPPDPTFAASSFDGDYSLLFQRRNLASIKFDFSEYISGAAHPGLHSKTVNYDFEQGRELSLDQLFLPGSNYFQVLADYSTAELNRRDIGFDIFSEGATPTPENYRNWNITADGLLVTFDEYQVAPYAAGPQTVNVPYAELQAVIDPQGPLGKILQSHR